MIFDEPLDAAVRTAAFFIGCERDDDVAVGLKPFLLIANQVGNPQGGLCLVVTRAPAVKITLLLGELKRLQGPVFALGFNDIGMREKQDGFAGASAVIADDQIAFLRDRAAEKDIGIRKAGGL
jgi:hypothetical protein